MKTKIYFLLLISIVFINFVDAQPLDSLLKKAYNQNPLLSNLQSKYESIIERAYQVNQLPNPSLGIGAPLLKPETRLGAQVFKLSLTQMFPWFGTLQAKEDVVLSMAKEKYESIAAAKLEIDFKVRSSYINIYLLQKKQNIIRSSLRIFESLERVSLAKLESGKSIGSDAIYVKIKVEELKQQIQILEKTKLVFISQIGASINEPTLSSVDVDTITLEPYNLVYNLDAYIEKIEQHHPLLRQIQRKIETSKKEEELNTLSGAPSFGFGIDYTMVDPRTDALPLDNGRDILIPKFIISIPIYRSKYSAKEREEKLKQKSYISKQQQLTNNMIRLLQTSKSDYDNALIVYHLASTQTRLSENAFEILLSDYSANGNRFDELMKTQNDIIKYRLDNITSIVNTYLVKYKIDLLTDY